MTPMSVRCKLAFLSVLRYADDIAPLDAEFLRMIFGLSVLEGDNILKRQRCQATSA